MPWALLFSFLSSIPGAAGKYFDNKTQVFCAPFVAITQAAALRDFAYAANDKSTSVGKYPTDYTLYLIGEFDDETGKLTAPATPQHLIKGVALKNS